MNLPEKTATRSLLIHGKWIAIEVWEFHDIQGIPAQDGGTYYGLFTDYKISGADIEFLKVGIDAVAFTHSTADEKAKIVAWLPKAGFAYVIEVITKRLNPPANKLFFINPDPDLSDPQKNDVKFFKFRCRYDVLRVIQETLLKISIAPQVTVDEILSSQLLTRLYERDEIESTLNHWFRKGIVEISTFNGTNILDPTMDEHVDDLINQYDWEEVLESTKELLSNALTTEKRDVFICHASEDKENLVRPLAEALIQENITVWYDEFELTIGDSLRRKIDNGIGMSRYGVVVLSKAFFNKNWPQHELDGLFEKEMATGEKVVLPIWHDIDKDEVMKYSTPLAGRYAISSNEGLEKITAEIKKVIKTEK